MEIDFHSILENKSLRPPFPVKVKVTQCTFVNAQSRYITAVGSGMSLPGFDCNFLQIIFPKGHNCSQFKVEEADPQGGQDLRGLAGFQDAV